MPEKFCSTCRNTGFVVVSDRAQTVRITKTRCPHCPAKPLRRQASPEEVNRMTARNFYRAILLGLVIAAVGVEILILIGGIL